MQPPTEREENIRQDSFRWGPMQGKKKVDFALKPMQEVTETDSGTGRSHLAKDSTCG